MTSSEPRFFTRKPPIYEVRAVPEYIRQDFKGGMPEYVMALRALADWAGAVYWSVLPPVQLRSRESRRSGGVMRFSSGCFSFSIRPGALLIKTASSDEPAQQILPHQLENYEELT